MIRMIVERRVCGRNGDRPGVGTAGVHAYPIDRGNVYLQIIELRNPGAFLVLVCGYAALWFSTPFFAASMFGSLGAIVAYRRPARAKQRALPPTSRRNGDRTPRSHFGESHFRDREWARRSPVADDSLSVDSTRRDGHRCRLGTGKTSACMFPYTDQLLRWKASVLSARLAGSSSEVKGDFCQQVQGMLTRAGRASDYTEIRLGETSAQPAPQRSDPVRGRAPSQRSSTTCSGSRRSRSGSRHTRTCSFVILLRRLADGHTTFAEVVSLHPSRMASSTARSPS